MANKTIPEFEILAFPVSAIPRQSSPAWNCADLFGEMLSLGQGDTGAGLPQGATTPATSWQSGDQAATLDIESKTNVSFVRFGANGMLFEGASSSARKNELSGYVIQGREAYLDARISKPVPPSSAVPLTSGRFVQNWETDKGTWKTVLTESPRRVCLVNSGKEAFAQIRTKDALPANRSVSVSFHLTQTRGGATGTNPPWAVVTVGDNSYGVLLQHNQQPQLVRYVNQGAQSLPIILKVLNTTQRTRFNGGRHNVSLRLLAGRIVVDIDGQKFHFLETQTVGKKSRPTESGWPSGRVNVAASGCHARFSLSHIKYSNPDGSAFGGSFTRRIKNAAVGFNSASATLTGYGRGWNRLGTVVAVTGAVAGRDVTYTAALTASPDGIHTPFVSSAGLSFEPAWVANSPAALDITAAVESGRVSMAMPPSMPGAQATLNIDLQILQKLNTRWGSYAKRYCPVTIRQRWQYDDGSMGAWNSLFKGYFNVENYTVATGLERKVTWTCHDPVLRLQGNNARVLRAAPLDFTFYKKALAGGNPNLYGWDCVQQILDTTVGRSAGGTVYPVFPASHYPLLSTADDTSGGWMFLQQLAQNIGTGAQGQPPTTTTWRLPPPFGDDALGWINRIAKLDYAVFYYGWPDGDTSAWPRPIYGRLTEILRGRSVKVLPDRVYVAGDANSLLTAIEIAGKPDRDVNEVWAMGSPPSDAMRDFFPGMPQTIGVARLPSSDPNSAERSWTRTLLLRSDLANLSPGDNDIAQYLANGVINDLTGVNRAFPTFHTRGDATLQWGDKVQPKMVLDNCGSVVNLGINGQSFWVEKVDHEFVVNLSFDTTLECYPASANGS